MARMIPHWTAAAILATAALAACDRSTPPVTETPGPVGTTASEVSTPANAPVSGHSIKADAGLDLATIKNQDMLHPQFELGPDDVETEVIFGVVRNEEKHSSFPMLLKKIGETWRIVEISEAPGQEWVHAAAGPADGEAWGFLDLVNDHPDTKAPQLTLIHTTDNGLTWQYFSAIKKPAPAAYMVDFALSDSGAGRLTLHLLENNDPVAQGYYHYKTKDGGKTWTGPNAEPDETTEAESLKQFNTVRDVLKDEADDAGPGAGGGKQ